LFITPALLLALHILLQLGAAAFDFLAHLIEGGRNALDFRHIHHANHGGWWRCAGRQRGNCLGRLRRALRLSGLRWALTLRLRLPLAWHEPARLILRRGHHGEG
jgi:hypothetical protein